MSFLGALLVKNCFDQNGSIMPARPAFQITGSGVVASDSSSLGGTGATIYTITSSAVTWQNDLVNSSGTHQYVSALSFSSSAAGGAIPINGTGSVLVWAATNTGPVFNQAAASGNGATFRISAQSSNAANGNGGTAQLTGGDLNGSGRRGSAQLCLGANTPQPMVEAAEPVAGQRAVALGRASAVTSTQLPANSGDGVVYVANYASAEPTVAAVTGFVMYGYPSATSSLGLFAGGIRFARACGNILVNQTIATGGSPGSSFTIQAQGGATGAAGGLLALNGGTAGPTGGGSGVVSISPDGGVTTALQLGLDSMADVIKIGSQAGNSFLGLFPAAITWAAGAGNVAIGQTAAAGAASALTITAQSAGGTNQGGYLILGGGQHAGASKSDGTVWIASVFQTGELEFTPANGANNMTNAQSDNNILNLLAGATLGFTINLIRAIVDTSLIFVRNNTSQTATIAYLTGGTVTLATNTSALICSNGTNLVKIMVGT
jgi:hypothetical protein